MNAHNQPQPSDRCLDSGLLLALRDAELAGEEQARARAHVDSCVRCSMAEEELHRSGQQIYTLLAMLQPPISEVPNSDAAFTRLEAALTNTHPTSEHEQPVRLVVPASKPPSTRSTRRRYGWLAAAAALLLVVLLLPGAGAVASQFLSMFRPQQFQSVVIDPRGITGEIWSYMQNFSNVQNSYDSTAYPATLSQSQAEQTTKLKVLLPASLPDGVGHIPRFGIIRGEQGTFTFDSARARAYLARTGQSEIAIPAQLDGAVYTITLSIGVNIDYYQQCSTDSKATLQCSGGTSFSLSELPVPTIQASGSNSLNDLRDFLLSLPKLSASLRSLLQHTDQHTGIVPIPVTAQQSAQTVTVQGTSALLLGEHDLGAAVVWEMHDTIYLMVSTNPDSKQLLQSANSLH